MTLLFTCNITPRASLCYSRCASRACISQRSYHPRCVVASKSSWRRWSGSAGACVEVCGGGRCPGGRPEMLDRWSRRESVDPDCNILWASKAVIGVCGEAAKYEEVRACTSKWASRKTGKVNVKPQGSERTRKSWWSACEAQVMPVVAGSAAD